MRSPPFLAAALALLLTACAMPQPEFAQAPPPPPAPGSCNAEAAQFAVGQAYGEAFADEVRRRAGASVSRTLRPGQAVTMEYIADRVTLDLDAAGRVTRVRCG